jgi:hypothetical protein
MSPDPVLIESRKDVRILVTTYRDYYQRAIDAGSPGVKLVLGPTGLGKTTGIAAVVRDNPDRKFIYLANRKQLLEQVAQLFEPDERVILRRDLEIVQQVLTTRRQEFDALLADHHMREGLAAARQRTRLNLLDPVVIRRTCNQIVQLDPSGRHIPRFMAEHAADLARNLLTAFRLVLTVARGKDEQGGRYRWLVAHPIIEMLFPTIPFRRKPEVRILLMTLQKAYYGFYDGSTTRNLTNLVDDDQTVIFLDEFDFLEHELVTMICRAPQIGDPFDFTAHFYRAMARHKLPNPDFPHRTDRNIRRRIEEIVELVDDIQGRGLAFPDINQFTIERGDGKPGHSLRSPAIFRTRHTVSTSPLYIKPTERSFQLETRQGDPGWQHASWLFNAVGTASTRILALFKELQRDHETYYWEMLRHCFRNTAFLDQVSTIAQFPRRSQDVRGPRGELLDSGYSLFDVDELEQLTDSEEVAVTFYQMLQTPENLLRALARRYLVFGLSATADLPRCVHHFDLGWLEDQELLLPTSEEDRADIQRMSSEKAALRGGRMTLAEVDVLDTTDPDQESLQRFLDAVARDDDFGDDTVGGHRSQRMHRFFAALRWVLTHGGDCPRLLLFLNTFQQVRMLLTTFADRAAEAGVFVVEPLARGGTNRGDEWFQALRLTLWGRRMTVVFFDAAVATEIRQRSEADAAFRALFYEQEPVIVATQYLSAGNGVNLTYADEEGGTERDFTHIALLEAPYYFFHKPDDEMTPDEVFAGRKANIWYQAKLFYARQISEHRFKQVLATVTRPAEWNQHYQNGSSAVDCLLNQLAIFIQALGRVERSREPTPDQVALLAPEVFRVFQVFVGPEFEPLREKHAPFASVNLHMLLEAVASRSAEHERRARSIRDERLRRANDRSREAIHGLVSRLEALRRYGLDIEARHDWEGLRQAVLRHDFHDEIVRKYACATSTPYLSRGRLNLTPDVDVLPLDVRTLESRVLHLDALYGAIADNLVVRDHFLKHGYDLRFDHPGSDLFTPYCLQAILAGAIGEEAIRALLTHEGVGTEGLPDALYEIADMCMVDLPWFIDAKNYSEQTLDRFSLPIDDPLWHPSLNEAIFAAHARDKLARIRLRAGPESKLVYINLVSSQPRPLRCFDAEFRRVARLDEAAIVVVQGALDREAPNRYQDAFATFLMETQRILAAAASGMVEGDVSGDRGEPASTTRVHVEGEAQ